MSARARRESVIQHLKYWGFLLLKLAGAALGAGFALWFLNLFWAPRTRLFHIAWSTADLPLSFCPSKQVTSGRISTRPESTIVL